MNQYLQSRKANCKNCYKCIRHCPVKSIRFSSNQANIVEDECILCGRCYVVCPQGAKVIVSDLDQIKQVIAEGREIIVSLAPSFIANFDGMDSQTMEQALKKLGFSSVEETSIGATIVKQKYEELMKENPERVLISSCCHTINTMIQKYYPEALSYLAPVDSPMIAHGKKIKSEHPDAYVVFIGPCISKKAEAGQYKGSIDAVLTFEELSTWLASEQIVLSAPKKKIKTGRAGNFPTTGGIIRSMYCDQQNVNYISIDGIKNSMRAIKDIIAGNVHGAFIEMSACIGSCVGGPAMSKKDRSPISDVSKVKEYVTDEDIKVNVDEKLDFSKAMAFTGVTKMKPGKAAIEEILRKMGKESPEDELNCGSCGYNTCREKAEAVYMGKADLTMCLPYLKERAESFSDTIISNTPNGVIVLDDNLNVQQINKSACKIMNIKRPSDILNCPVVRVLDPVDFIEVTSTGRNVHNKRIYLAEYKKYVEETILYDKNYSAIMIIMRDVTEEERQRLNKEKISRNTIEITDKVIEKQMRVVQEIASLLGETTAETKIALTNLKETLENE